MRGNIFPKRDVRSRCGQHEEKSREQEQGVGLGKWRQVSCVVQPGRNGAHQVGWQDVGFQSFNEPGNSLVSVCQRSIFLSLFLRQSNQCLSLSPFALIPRDTPPEKDKRTVFRFMCSVLSKNTGDTVCVTLENQYNVVVQVQDRY